MEQNRKRLESNFEKLRKKDSEQTLTEKLINEVFNHYLKIVNLTIEKIESNKKEMETNPNCREENKEIETQLVTLIRKEYGNFCRSSKDILYRFLGISFHFLNYLHKYGEMDNYLSSIKIEREISDVKHNLTFCMFNYYAGITMLTKHSPGNAFIFFSNAYEYLPENSPNRRKILIPLVVLQLRKGLYPPRQLIEKHNLMNELGPLISAVQSGNVKRFEEHVKQYELFFIYHGLFLYIESLKLITLRNLFEFVLKNNPNKHKPTYDTFKKALEKSTGRSHTDIEFELIMSNLVHKKLCNCQIYRNYGRIIFNQNAMVAYFTD